MIASIPSAGLELLRIRRGIVSHTVKVSYAKVVWSLRGLSRCSEVKIHRLSTSQDYAPAEGGGSLNNLVARLCAISTEAMPFRKVTGLVIGRKFKETTSSFPVCGKNMTLSHAT